MRIAPIPDVLRKWDRIVFSSDREGHWDIYTINVDGSGLTRVTTSVADDETPAWRP